MKYLLKFNIETWGGEPWCVKTQQLVLKVEFIEERVKKNGFFQVSRGVLSEARCLFECKSYEVVEGPESLDNEYGHVFNIWRSGDSGGYIAMSLDMYSKCASANFMGFEPIPDEEPQTISSPEEGE